MSAFADRCQTSHTEDWLADGSGFKLRQLVHSGLGSRQVILCKESIDISEVGYCRIRVIVLKIGFTTNLSLSKFSFQYPKAHTQVKSPSDECTQVTEWTHKANWRRSMAKQMEGIWKWAAKIKDVLTWLTQGQKIKLFHPAALYTYVPHTLREIASFTTHQRQFRIADAK